MNLKPYTRRLDKCRKRWNRSTIRYVLGVALIVRAARRAAKDERRWGRWIRDEIHMNRSTVYRYLRVAAFFKTNVFLRKHLVSLSLAKIYALSRIRKNQAVDLIRSRRAQRMSDAAFLKLATELQPKLIPRTTRPNLFKSLEASVRRLERSMRRWLHSDVSMPVALQAKLQARLQTMSKALNRSRKTSAAAS